MFKAGDKVVAKNKTNLPWLEKNVPEGTRGIVKSFIDGTAFVAWTGGYFPRRNVIMYPNELELLDTRAEV